MMTVDREETYSDSSAVRVPYRVRVFSGAAKESGSNHIVVVSDLSVAGSGVAGVIEGIAARAASLAEASPAGVTLIEHCPQRPQFEETFALVTFKRRRPRLGAPSWRPVERRDVERMIGERLETRSLKSPDRSTA
jgi:hypothetical protein